MSSQFRVKNLDWKIILQDILIYVFPLQQIEQKNVPPFTWRLKTAFFQRHFFYFPLPPAAFQSFIFGKNLLFISAVFIIRKSQKDQPEYGMEYSEDFKSEFARRVSAVCQRVCSKSFSCSGSMFFVYSI